MNIGRSRKAHFARRATPPGGRPCTTSARKGREQRFLISLRSCQFQMKQISNLAEILELYTDFHKSSGMFAMPANSVKNSATASLPRPRAMTTTASELLDPYSFSKDGGFGFFLNGVTAGTPVIKSACMFRTNRRFSRDISEEFH